jgi:hypothetical protein
MQELFNKAQQALGLILISEASMAKNKNTNKKSVYADVKNTANIYNNMYISQ